VLFAAPAVVGAGDATAIGAGWDFSYLQVTDGDTTLDASVELEPVSGGIKGRIPMLYQAPGGSQDNVTFEFVLDSGGNLIGANLIRYDDDGTASALSPEPGSALVPLILVATPGGGVEAQLVSNQPLDATSAEFVFNPVPLPSGSAFTVGLVATDAGGNATVATASGTVP
jgi:hypothetical protein